MGKLIFNRTKKITCILLAVLLVVSLTAAAGAACTNNTTANTTAATTPSSSTTDDKTLSVNDLGTLLASLLQGMGYNLDLSDSGSNSGSGDYSDLSNLFDNAGTGVTTA
jgi:hypothetical protein